MCLARNYAFFAILKGIVYDFVSYLSACRFVLLVCVILTRFNFLQAYCKIWLTPGNWLLPEWFTALCYQYTVLVLRTIKHALQWSALCLRNKLYFKKNVSIIYAQMLY